MNFGYVEIHKMNGQSVRRFIKPKCPLLQLVAPFICTDIYERGNGFRRFRELNLSHIGWGVVATGFCAAGILALVEFILLCAPKF